MSQRVVILGAGGHAKVTLELLRVFGIEVAGLLDANRDRWGERVLGVPVLGGDERLPVLKAEGLTHVAIGVGTPRGDTGPRRRAYEAAIQAGFQIVGAVHPTAVVAPSATLGSGTTIMAGAVVQAAARLGTHVLINTAAVVEHDCVIGDHVHIATGAHLAGGVEVGEGAHIGLRAAVREGVHIGRNAIVGAGAVVVADVPVGVVVVGVPARIARSVEA